MQKKLYIFGRLDFSLPKGILGYSKSQNIEIIQYDLFKKAGRTWSKKFRELSEKIEKKEV
ncbi:hypothetical protein QWY31_08185 [Cytophagales bacterium LB-30]|uniref:Uncharacterized protein n=1 Tax=Shiella aurantiaca TaxID=3058365 RepID=A0ABT8F4U5_9BACT|nr:hypothetical protein [Shiella aurantiaca]MDN4165475.1 hypothetical protein [Shiella aurantiaca]